jgi:RNA polymerase sigma factor (sigma-70 family)
MVHMAGASEVSRLVRASAGGDESAWQELVRRYSPLVMAVTRHYQLAAADAQDVSQTVWLRLVENLASLRQPDALPGWLATTAQRECSRHVQRGRRVQPVDPHTNSAMQQCSTTVDLDADILRAELRQALRDGLSELSARDQWLLRLRAADPPKTYDEISQLLGMPIGSVGPTVRRSLDRLQQTSAVRAYLAAAPTASRGKTSRGTGGDRRELAEVD